MSRFVIIGSDGFTRENIILTREKDLRYLTKTYTEKNIIAHLNEPKAHVKKCKEHYFLEKQR